MNNFSVVSEADDDPQKNRLYLHLHLLDEDDSFNVWPFEAGGGINNNGKT